MIKKKDGQQIQLSDVLELYDQRRVVIKIKKVEILKPRQSNLFFIQYQEDDKLYVKCLNLDMLRFGENLINFITSVQQNTEQDENVRAQWLEKLFNVYGCSEEYIDTLSNEILNSDLIPLDYKVAVC